MAAIRGRRPRGGGVAVRRDLWACLTARSPQWARGQALTRAGCLRGGRCRCRRPTAPYCRCGSCRSTTFTSSASASCEESAARRSGVAEDAPAWLGLKVRSRSHGCLVERYSSRAGGRASGAVSESSRLRRSSRPAHACSARRGSTRRRERIGRFFELEPVLSILSSRRGLAKQRPCRAAALGTHAAASSVAPLAPLRGSLRPCIAGTQRTRSTDAVPPNPPRAACRRRPCRRRRRTGCPAPFPRRARRRDGARRGGDGARARAAPGGGADDQVLPAALDRIALALELVGELARGGV